MLLALDVGNTNITLGVYGGEKLLFVTRMATNPPRMEDEYASAMLSILHLYNIHTSQVNGAVLSSVVPRLTDDLARAVRRVWKVEPFIVSAQSVPELKVKRDVPNTLGADLVVGAVAAKAMYHGPCIVIDMGTATTLTGLNADGEVCGVVIIPGVGTSLDALTSRRHRCLAATRWSASSPAWCSARRVCWTVCATALKMSSAHRARWSQRAASQVLSYRIAAARSLSVIHFCWTA